MSELAPDLAARIASAVMEHRTGLCGCLSDYGCGKPACIACKEHQNDGHADDCWLAELLKGNHR